MKKFSLLLLSLALAAGAHAGTYTWTGAAGDGLYFTAGNWDYTDDGGATTAPAATSPGNTPTDNIVIANGDTVSYNPGGDWKPSGTTTISGGSTLVQINGGAWAEIRGALVLDGGTYDSGTSGQVRFDGTVTVRNGGALFLRGTASNSSLGAFVIETGGTVVRMGAWGGAIPLVMRGGWFECQGTFSNPNAADEYTSGTIFVSSGEFQPPSNTEFDLGGVDWIVRMISPRQNGVPILSGGSLTLFNSGNDGFYQMAGVHADFPAGSGAIVTVPRAPADVYTRYFSNGKFTVAGATLTQAEFAEQIVVEAAATPTNGNASAYSTFRLAAVSAYGITSPAASGIGETSATISAFVSKTDPGATVYALWGAAAAATDDLSAWDHAESAGAAVAETSFTKALSGLTTDVPVHYAFAIVTNGAVAAATAVKTFTPSAYSAVFTGAAGDGLWATPGNWRDGVVPTEADTIRIDADCTRTGNLNLQNWNITVNGASFVCTAELNPGPRTVSNGSITAVTFIAGGPGNALVVRGSSVVSTRTTNLGQAPRGFYGADPHFDFRSGAPCSYTYAYSPEGEPPDFAEEFNALFVGGKILVDGAALTAADIGRVAYSTNTTDHTVTLTLLETTVNAAFASAASASVDGLDATLSASVEVGGGKPLYVLVGTNATDLAETLVAAAAADATTYTFSTNGVEGTLYHYQFRLGEADDPEAVLDSATPQTFFASVTGNLFTGTANEHASDARNWSKGVVPAASDVVYVVADVAKRGTMQWDLENATVAGWVQIGERVNFLTTPSNVLTVAGDASLSGGANWTHLGPSTAPDTIVNVAVTGDLSLSADSVIQAGTASDAGARQSRGWSRSGPGFRADAGGSHAGDGGHATNMTGFVSYGSILDPLSWGSGAPGDGNAYAGGGVVKLVVGGTLANDGIIASRGFGYALEGFGSGSGGSVNITAGALAGSGAIDANGGNNGLLGPGSGGRVKVALTGANASFAGFSGTIEAIGGSMQNQTQADSRDISPAAAGTVCLSTAADTAPTVRVHNEFHYGNGPATWRVATDPDAAPSGTHLPAMQDADAPAGLRHSRWELSGHGALRLTQNVRILSLSLANDNGSQCVYTDGHELFVKELTIAGTTKRSGRYTAADLPNVIVGTGAVVVDVMPTVLFVR